MQIFAILGLIAVLFAAVLAQDIPANGTLVGDIGQLLTDLEDVVGEVVEVVL